MTKDEAEALKRNLEVLRRKNQDAFTKVLDTDFQDYHDLPDHLFAILYEIENQFDWTYKIISILNEVLQREVDK